MCKLCVVFKKENIMLIFNYVIGVDYIDFDLVIGFWCYLEIEFYILELDIIVRFVFLVCGSFMEVDGYCYYFYWIVDCILIFRFLDCMEYILFCYFDDVCFVDL